MSVLHANPDFRTSIERILSKNLDIAYPQLSTEEIAAIHHYTCYHLNAFAELNFKLRGTTDRRFKGLNEFYAKFARTLSTALSKLPPHKGTVYRGAFLHSRYMSVYAEAYRTSASVIERTFLSTSTDFDIALEFAEPKPTDISSTEKKRVIFFIASESGKDIKDISYHGPNFYGYDQSEILFPCYTHFKVRALAEKIEDNKEYTTFDLVEVF